MLHGHFHMLKDESEGEGMSLATMIDVGEIDTGLE